MFCEGMYKQRDEAVEMHLERVETLDAPPSTRPVRDGGHATATTLAVMRAKGTGPKVLLSLLPSALSPSSQQLPFGTNTRFPSLFFTQVLPRTPEPTIRLIKVSFGELGDLGKRRCVRPFGELHSTSSQTNLQATTSPTTYFCLKRILNLSRTTWSVLSQLGLKVGRIESPSTADTDTMQSFTAIATGIHGKARTSNSRADMC